MNKTFCDHCGKQIKIVGEFNKHPDAGFGAGDVVRTSGIYSIKIETSKDLCKDCLVHIIRYCELPAIEVEEC